MDIIVGCEESQAVTIELRALGHNAFSCDLIDCSGGHPEWHLKMDVFSALRLRRWGGGIFFPTCTFLCSSGLHWNTRVPGRKAKTDAAVGFATRLFNCDLEKVALENPVGCLSTRFMRPTQIIQPWQFGHPESKATCLWLKGLPELKPTRILPLPPSGRWANQTPSGQNRLGPSADRAKIRSKTYPGIARAMAQQWFGPVTDLEGLL